MITYCNPLDLSYRYQHIIDRGIKSVSREGADPTLVFFKGIYYMFVSMSAGFWYSENLLDWKFHENKELLIYDYAPDVRQNGEYLIFTASKMKENCSFLRSRNPLQNDFEEVPGVFPFWDPNTFVDDDGRVYFYWGCSNAHPIYGCELDPEHLTPLCNPIPLIFGDMRERGYERAGENGVIDKENNMFVKMGIRIEEESGELFIPEEAEIPKGLSNDLLKFIIENVGNPYIEGAFMTKYEGRYYLQYACPGTKLNTYSDGVYVSEHPLGSFTLQNSNPFSSKPGGFCTGAGHGSTIQDKYGNWWHAATMRISINHIFERRVGLFPAGIDEDGVLFCNQNFADYPLAIPEGKFDSYQIKPKWMLLSYKKPVIASSTAEGSSTSLAVNEDIRTWWSAASAAEGEWICVDLEQSKMVHAIQVNLADESIDTIIPDSWYNIGEHEKRYIELRTLRSNYTIEASRDGSEWFMLECVSRECSNAYFEYPDGINARYIRVTAGELPYHQVLRVSGLRIFGKGMEARPAAVRAKALRTGDLDAKITWNSVERAQGYNVRYGMSPDKLYMSWLLYDSIEINLSTLMKGYEYFVCVDSFNEGGITEGEVVKVDRYGDFMAGESTISNSQLLL